jgi:hypothetical protein
VIGLAAKEADIVDSTHLVLAAVGQSLLNFSSSQSFAPLVSAVPLSRSLEVIFGYVRADELQGISTISG